MENIMIFYTYFNKKLKIENCFPGLLLDLLGRKPENSEYGYYNSDNIDLIFKNNRLDQHMKMCDELVLYRININLTILEKYKNIKTLIIYDAPDNIKVYEIPNTIVTLRLLDIISNLNYINDSITDLNIEYIIKNNIIGIKYLPHKLNILTINTGYTKLNSNLNIDYIPSEIKILYIILELNRVKGLNLPVFLYKLSIRNIYDIYLPNKLKIITYIYPFPILNMSKS